jgi:hypothetical protein
VCGYFIDLAVYDRNGGYLMAIECDGTAYHSSRSARDRDYLRQQILENLGWTFLRIWGREWYRNRARQFARLRNELGKAQERSDQRHAARAASGGNAADSDPPSRYTYNHPATTDLVPASDVWIDEAPVAVEDSSEQSTDENVAELGTSALPPFRNPPQIEPPPVRAPRLTIAQARQELIRLREKTINPTFLNVPREKGILRQRMLEAFLSYRPTTHGEFLKSMPYYLRVETSTEHIKRFLEEILEIISNISID